MTGTRKLVAILAADVVGYSRLADADEDRILARLRALRSDLIDPTIAVHNGRVVKRTGDGFLVEFRSVVDAVRCAIELQNVRVLCDPWLLAGALLSVSAKRDTDCPVNPGSEGPWRVRMPFVSALRRIAPCIDRWSIDCVARSRASRRAHGSTANRN
jgi:hypothetical protein